MIVMQNQLKHYPKYILGFLFILVTHLVLAQDQELYSFEIFIKNNDTLRYRLLLPKGFSKDKQYPLILFLHGSGERGNDNISQLAHGSSLFTNDKNRDSFPAIVVFPQCPKEDYWANVKRDETKKGLEKYKFKRFGKPTKAMRQLIDLMDVITNNSYVKKNQIYVGGLSMGGMGTFDILKWKPNMFAAAFPICGGGNPKSVKKYAKRVSFWIFDGGKDDVVYPYFSLGMVTALQKRGANVKLTYFENDNHNSWDSAFSEPNLLPWLFSNIKNKNEQ